MYSSFGNFYVFTHFTQRDFPIKLNYSYVNTIWFLKKFLTVPSQIEELQNFLLETENSKTILLWNITCNYSSLRKWNIFRHFTRRYASIKFTYSPFNRIKILWLLKICLTSETSQPNFLEMSFRKLLILKPFLIWNVTGKYPLCGKWNIFTRYPTRYMHLQNLIIQASM